MFNGTMIISKAVMSHIYRGNLLFINLKMENNFIYK